MNIDKLKYSKCPHCKKYGIGAWRGVSRASTFVVTCKYCGKKFRVNPALAFLLTVAIALVFAGLYFIIDIYFINVPEWLVIVLGLILCYLIFRICPMEEVKDK